MNRTCGIALAAIMFSGSTYAMEPPQTSSLEDFLQSLNTVYVTSQRCRHISYMNTETYVQLINGYISRYYRDTGAPYWALPVVNDRYKSKAVCLIILQEGLSEYEAASAQFVNDYPTEPRPPRLPDLYSNITYAPQYVVTSPVLVSPK